MELKQLMKELKSYIAFGFKLVFQILNCFKFPLSPPPPKLTLLLVRKKFPVEN